VNLTPRRACKGPAVAPRAGETAHLASGTGGYQPHGHRQPDRGTVSRHPSPRRLRGRQYPGCRPKACVDILIWPRTGSICGHSA